MSSLLRFSARQAIRSAILTALFGFFGSVLSAGAAILTISPATLPTLTVGVPVSITLTVTGGTGIGNVFTLGLGSQIPGLTINTPSPGMLSGTPTAAGPYNRQFIVTDSGGNTGSVTYTGTVNPAAGATLTIFPTALPTLTVGVPVSITLTVTGGTGTGLVWTLGAGSQIPGLAINTPSPGVLSGTPTTAGPYNRGFNVTDSGGNTGSITYTGQVNPAAGALTILPAALPTLTVGVPVSITLTVTGGTGSGLVWSLGTGSQIPGLAINPVTGVLSGTPITAGPYSRGFTVTDSGGNTGSITYTGTVNAAPTIIIITPATINPLTVGTPVSVQLVADCPGDIAPTTSGALPAGLTLNTSNGIISGTPTTAGAYSWTLTLACSNGANGSITYSGTVTAAVPTMPEWMWFMLAALLVGLGARRLTTSRSLRT